jgi:hypothetical protein
MSDLENRAKAILVPLMTGAENTVLSPKDCDVLSQWAYKTTLVTDLYDGTEAIPGHWYERFYDERRPPKHASVVWTFGYVGKKHVTYSSKRILVSSGWAWGNRRADVVSGTYSVCQLTTIVALGVGFQVLSHRHGNWFPAFADPADSRCLQRIWPHCPTKFAWPPEQFALGDGDLHITANRMPIGAITMIDPERPPPII